MMKQHVCLITPPSVFLLDERVFMSLGILRVAAALEQQGFIVEMLDLSGVANFQEAARDHALASSANIFGLTATSPQMPAALHVRDAIRQVRPDARIILGGPHVTLVNAARKKLDKAAAQGRATRAFERLESSFDVLVAGDGEDAIFQAVASEAPKLVDADDPRSSMFLTSSRLETLAWPARHLVDASSYHYNIDGVRAMSLICQLGCPFGCRFCGGRESPSLRRVRLRSAQSVVAEISHLHATYGVTGFMLYDDELNVNPNMTELMRAIAQRASDLGVEFRLRGFIKAELFTDEQAEAMYQAGFRWILTGFESGSPRILKNINKRATLEDNTRCVEIAHRHGMKVKALMSAGHPGESDETVQETHQWLLHAHPDDFDMTIISVYPGTPYYDQAVRGSSSSDVWVYTVNGDRLYSYELDFTTVADYYKGDPEGGYTSYVFTDYLKAEELVALRNFVESDVRHKLGIPFNSSAAAIRYEHSMGQIGYLQGHILRTTSDAEKEKVAAVGAGAGLVTIQHPAQW
jgi:anaerobic magnesium-protoporphyrin IX monomethyl ester cyclase